MGVVHRPSLTVVVLDSENCPAPHYSPPPGPHAFLGGGDTLGCYLGRGWAAGPGILPEAAGTRVFLLVGD